MGNQNKNNIFFSHFTGNIKLHIELFKKVPDTQLPTSNFKIIFHLTYLKLVSTLLMLLQLLPQRPVAEYAFHSHTVRYSQV